MQTVKCEESSIKVAVDVLRNGGLVVFPCETVYGIAADSTNSSAIEKLNKYKERPLGKPYAIMCSSQNMAEKYVNINPTANDLYKTFLPGPVTIISKGKGIVSPGVESENGTLGVRIPDYKFMIKLIENFGHPIVATSANASYKRRPYKVSDILENVSEKQKSLIDLVIDAGELPHNEPSTVIDTTLDDTVVLRQGEIKVNNKNEILSRKEENTENFAKELWQKYENSFGKRSIVFALQGEMGAGKTIFTKGLARAMGITELVTSPTFAIENEYEKGEIKLYHFDAWRLENSDEITSLGFEKLIKDKSVVAIEWADKVSDVVRKHDDEAIIIWVNIKFGKLSNDRVITWGNI
jgi:L-threonylcarbamoyladenylate synthase